MRITAALRNGAQNELRRSPEPVEKVGDSLVGGPGEPENKAKTLQKRRIQPLNRGQKRARRGFSTGCGIGAEPVPLHGGHLVPYNWLYSRSRSYLESTRRVSTLLILRWRMRSVARRCSVYQLR